MIKLLRLQQQFDAAAIKNELASIDAALWSNHYNTSMYQGGWTALPLRSLGGSPENIVAIHQGTDNGQEYLDTPLLQRCPYIRSVLDHFQCPKTAVRLMKLEAGSVIKAHTDHAMNYEDGEARLHIPVVTNAGVEFWLDDAQVTMQEGECWYLNLSLKHAVYNHSTTGRIHLVIDLVTNSWLKQLFSTEAAHIEYVEENRTNGYSTETQREIITQLRRMNTASALALANQMEKELEPQPRN